MFDAGFARTAFCASGSKEGEEAGECSWKKVRGLFAQNNRNGKDSECAISSLFLRSDTLKEMKHLEDKKRLRSSMLSRMVQLQDACSMRGKNQMSVLLHKAEHNLRGDPKEGSSEQPKPVELSDEDPGAMKEFVAQKAPKRKGGMETHLSFKVNGW